MTIDHIYPCTIIADPYSGSYSDALFTAWNLHECFVPGGVSDGDTGCEIFWKSFNNGDVKNFLGEPLFCGKGATPNEAYEDLVKKISALNQ